MVLNPVKHDYYRQRFDVAHEFGNLVMHSDAEPGGRTVENHANRFAAELLMPAAEVRGELPTVMNGAAWQSFARSKERWGASIQALLYRARAWAPSPRSPTAMPWPRSPAGRAPRRARLITVLEQPSMLPRAVELLAAEGITSPPPRPVPRSGRPLPDGDVPRPAPAPPEEDADPAQPSGVTSLFR